MKCLLASLVLGLSISAASAQSFSEGSVTPANQGTAVINAGSVLYAYNFDPSSTTATIDGVTFTGTSQETGNFVDSISGKTDFSISGSGQGQQAGGGTDVGGFDTNLSTGFQDLNASGLNNGGSDFTITLDGLTQGQTYYAQFFYDANQHDARTMALGDGTATSGTVTAGGNIDNHDPVGAYNPPYIIDQFTATGSTETLAELIGGGNGAQLSGFVLETPEPSTYAMILGGLGLLGLCVRRKALSLS